MAIITQRAERPDTHVRRFCIFYTVDTHSSYLTPTSPSLYSMLVCCTKECSNTIRLEEWQRGRMRSTRNRVCGTPASRVRIPPPPQNNEVNTDVLVDYVLRESGEIRTESRRSQYVRDEHTVATSGVDGVRYFMRNEIKYPRE